VITLASRRRDEMAETTVAVLRQGHESTGTWTFPPYRVTLYERLDE
jgi:hypothetical protein